MKFLAICLAGVLLSVRAFADPLLPRDVVRVAVQAAQEDKLGLFLQFVDVVSIHEQKSQPRSPQEIVQLLKSIPLKNVTTTEPESGWKQGTRVNVTMTLPQKLRFVILCTGLPDGEPRWKIIEIYKIE
jgi:hypothetical protein